MCLIPLNKVSTHYADTMSAVVKFAEEIDESVRHGPMTSSCDKVLRAVLSCPSRPKANIVSFQVKAGYVERSNCPSPTFQNPYRNETDNKMRARVGVRNAVAKDMWSFMVKLASD